MLGAVIFKNQEGLRKISLESINCQNFYPSIKVYTL